MNIAIVDYNSGNISSVINSFKEVAQNKVNIEVTSDLKKIKSSDKVILPGQGSFKSCVDALKNISGLVGFWLCYNIFLCISCTSLYFFSMHGFLKYSLLPPICLYISIHIGKVTRKFQSRLTL